jgi:mRNA-degrading endonuclease RelE of RelBE toxin-antitoxin system
MMRLLLTRRARKSLLGLRGTKNGKSLGNALDAIADSPHREGFFDVPGGYRERVGRYRILYTVHADENLVRVWIIDMEKSTKKDYDRWIGYILKQL